MAWSLVRAARGSSEGGGSGLASWTLVGEGTGVLRDAVGGALLYYKTVKILWT